jgi:hypothetical protein
MMSVSKWIVQLGIVLLTIVLGACSWSSSQPPPDLVKQAIALQFSETQQVLRQQLRLADESQVTIERIGVGDRTPIVIEELPGFRIQGTYDFTLQLPDRRLSRQANPFEIYLQRQPDTKTWQLAKPDPAAEGEPVWLTHPLSPVTESTVDRSPT